VKVLPSQAVWSEALSAVTSD